jgi:hypothetical protein
MVFGFGKKARRKREEERKRRAKVDPSRLFRPREEQRKRRRAKTLPIGITVKKKEEIKPSGIGMVRKEK